MNKVGSREVLENIATNNNDAIDMWIDNLIDAANESASLENHETTESHSDEQKLASEPISVFANDSNSSPKHMFSDNAKYSQYTRDDYKKYSSRVKVDDPMQNSDKSQNPYNTDVPMGADTSRLTMAMEALNRKLDEVGNFSPRQSYWGAYPRSTDSFLRDEMARAEALTERAISQIIARVEDGERKSEKSSFEVNEILKELKEAQKTISERLQNIEASGPNEQNADEKSVQSLKNLEQSLAILEAQISETKNRTEKIERDIEDSSSYRLTESDVARILNQSLDNVNEGLSSINGKFDDFSNRLDAVEEVSSRSVEQFGDSLNSLSERISSNEAITKTTNEKINDFMADLAERLNSIEANGSDKIQQELEGRISGLFQKVNNIESNIDNLMNNAKSEMEDKFAKLVSSINTKLNDDSGEYLEAIEKLGSQLVKTAKNLDERIKTIEELNANAKDSSLAMRIELGRITRAIDERLSAIEHSKSDNLDKAGEYINRLAEQVTNRLDAFESQSEDWAKQMTQKTEELGRNYAQKQEELLALIKDTDNKLNDKIDEKINHINDKIFYLNNGEKNNHALQSSMNELIDRLDEIDAKNSKRQTIQAPSFTYPDQRDFVQPQIFEEHEDKEHEDLHTQDEPHSLADIDDVDEPHELADNVHILKTAQDENDHEFLYDEVEHDDEKLDHKDDEIFFVNDDKTSHFEEFGDDFAKLANEKQTEYDNSLENELDLSDSLLQLNDDDISGEANKDANSKSANPETDYIERARRAANKAAQEAEASKKKPAMFDILKNNNGSKSSNKPKKEGGFHIPGLAKLEAFIKPKKKDEVRKSGIEIVEGALVDNGKNPQQISPIAAAAAGAAVIAAAAGAYTMTHHQAPKQNDIPKGDNAATNVMANHAAETAPVGTAHNPAPVNSTANDVQARPMPNAQASNPTDNNASNNASHLEGASAAHNQNAASDIIMSSAGATNNSEHHEASADNSLKQFPAAQQPVANNHLNAAEAKPFHHSVVHNEKVAHKAKEVAKKPEAKVAKKSEETHKRAEPQPLQKSVVKAAPAKAASESSNSLYEKAQAMQQSGDNKSAARLMYEAAKAGNVKAQNALSKMYEEGKGVPKDAQKAKAWTQKAAQSGSRKALYNMGVYYAEGDSGKKDYEKAAGYFKQAAKKGMVDSQFNLGAMSEQGLGVKKNDADAYYWYSLAAKSGDKDAAEKAKNVLSKLSEAEKNGIDRKVSTFRAEDDKND